MQTYRVQNVGFFRVGLFGDIIVALHGIYATKVLYPNARLIIYTSAYGELIYPHFWFIDEVVNIETYELEKLATHIDSKHFDLFILTNPNRKYCALLAQTHCKRIYSFLSAGNFFRWRFKTLFYSRAYSTTPHYKRILNLVCSTAQAYHDTNIFDFSQITITPQTHNKVFIEQFLTQNNIDKKNTIILINPFVRSAFCNLTLKGWEILIHKLADTYPHFTFIIPTYQANPTIHITATNNNIFIFYNNHDVLNLAALLNHTTLLISPSTGTSHLANNLNIPMIWLCSKSDSKKWMGDNMQSDLFVILPTTTQNMTQTQENHAIDQTYMLFQSYFK